MLADHMRQHPVRSSNVIHLLRSNIIDEFSVDLVHQYLSIAFTNLFNYLVDVARASSKKGARYSNRFNIGVFMWVITGELSGILDMLFHQNIHSNVSSRSALPYLVVPQRLLLIISNKHTHCGCSHRSNGKPTVQVQFNPFINIMVFWMNTQ
jgi:hypothetical protein